jgi:hypothetical protein
LTTFNAKKKLKQTSNIQSIKDLLFNINRPVDSGLLCEASDMSIRRLAVVLGFLRKKCQNQVKRNKPPYIASGVPNLIVCEQSDILARVLNLNLFTCDEQLPNDDEVLICTETTASTDVEIFLRRALNSHQAKIYSIVNVHELTYDNSVRIIQLYVELPKSPAFNLCVFCSQEQEDKCVFVTAFNRYRISVPKQLDLKALQAYLIDHLSNQQGKAMTASLV